MSKPQIELPGDGEAIGTFNFSVFIPFQGIIKEKLTFETFHFLLEIDISRCNYSVSENLNSTSHNYGAHSNISCIVL